MEEKDSDSGMGESSGAEVGAVVISGNHSCSVLCLGWVLSAGANCSLMELSLGAAPVHSGGPEPSGISIHEMLGFGLERELRILYRQLFSQADKITVVD